jgi:hypothetical protein
VVEDWMGRKVKTLEDLLRPGLTAVCGGINPSPVSVAAGHYTKDASGSASSTACVRWGQLPDVSPGSEDDVASSRRQEARVPVLCLLTREEDYVYAQRSPTRK